MHISPGEYWLYLQYMALAVAMVVLVIFGFLHSARATVIASVAVPISLLGSLGAMYLLGYSLNNLSLMALTIATGFVVDDAIVMIENIARHREMGKPPMQAALQGAGQIGFTIVSLTISLVAVLIPLLFMQEVIGRLFREFAVTLAITILISAVVSLTLTPMMCARWLEPLQEGAGRLGRAGNGDDIVDAHHQVGDDDGAHRHPEPVGAGDVAVGVFLFGQQQLDADPEEQHGAHQFQVRDRQQGQRKDDQQDAQANGTDGAPDDALASLGGVQLAHGQCDDDSVVAAQQNVDEHDLPDGQPEGGGGEVHSDVPEEGGGKCTSPGSL